MPSVAKKLLSYLLPVKLNTYQTAHNGTLSVTLFNGKKLLDTAISNYSYGSLQAILYKALRQLPFSKSAKEILVLGMGAGSVVDTIRKDFHSNANITLVEIDEEVIAISKNEFNINLFDNISIVHEDAIRFMKINRKKYDLVIVDLFIIDTIPEPCTHPVFLQQLIDGLLPKGQLLYNTIDDTLTSSRLSVINSEFIARGLETSLLKKVGGSNNIILGRLK